ncbi:putative Chemotaxis signal transduction protein [Gammaproteobacteria bacterium]
MSGMLIFDVADATFALSLDLVREVLPLPALSQPPGLPSLIEGFFNLRGQAVAVLRLDRILGREGSKPSFYAPIILLQARGGLLTLLVDRVRGIVEVNPTTLRAIPDRDTFNGCITAEFSADGTSVLLLAFDRVLLEEEQQSLVEHQAAAARRLTALNQDAAEATE